MDLSSIFRFSDMLKYFPKILSRFPVTLLIVVVSVAGGLVLGFILAAARIFKIPVLRELAALYISFVRGTPVLVQLFVVYYGCLLYTSTNIPDLSQVTSMGTFAFSECNNLKGEVNLASLNDIPYRAFLNTPIESVVLSDSLQKINDEAFSGTKIASITFPESLTAIGSKSFANTLLNQDTLIIPDNVATIGSSAFSGATIKKLVLGSGLTNTSNNEFAGIDGLESVTVQNSSDVLNLSNAGLPQNVTINYTIQMCIRDRFRDWI